LRPASISVPASRKVKKRPANKGLRSDEPVKASDESPDARWAFSGKFGVDDVTDAQLGIGLEVFVEPPVGAFVAVVHDAPEGLIDGALVGVEDGVADVVGVGVDNVGLGLGVHEGVGVDTSVGDGLGVDVTTGGVTGGVTLGVVETGVVGTTVGVMVVAGVEGMLTDGVSVSVAQGIVTTVQERARP